MSNISRATSRLAWESTADIALQDKNLTADIRVSRDVVQINKLGIIDEVEVAIGLKKAPAVASKEETLDNLKDQVEAYFSDQLHSLVKETGMKLGSEEYKKFCYAAVEDFDRITGGLTTTIQSSKISTSQAIQEAHQNTISSLYLLRGRFARPNTTPQFCKTRDGKWSVLQTASYLENLVLSGGGVKGAGYVGFFNAAEKAGALKNLKRLAGSSAGAITASLLASGMRAADFEAASNRTNFFSMLTGQTSNPVIKEATLLEPLTGIFAGTYAVDQVNQEMVGSVKKYFQSVGKVPLAKKIIELKEKGLLTQAEANSLHGLEKAVTVSLKTHLLTFRELALLQKCDPCFKGLTITGFDVTKQKEFYYNAETAPSMAISEAVRASMSLPLLYEAVREAGDIVEDGGIGNNLPSEVFSKEPQEKTMVLGFDNNGRFYDVVNRGEIHQPVSWIQEEVSGNQHLQQRADRDAQKLYDAGPNALDIQHGELETTSFLASDQTLHVAQRQAEVRTWEQLALRQHQAVNHIFNTLEEAMKRMTSTELEDIAIEYASKPRSKELLLQPDREAVSQAAQKILEERETSHRS